jgi:mono/diheme cytochrome c family protein
MEKRLIPFAALLPILVMPHLGFPGPLEDKPAEAETQWTAPVGERDRANPLPASPEAIKQGRGLFQEHCAVCHGRSGQGKKVYRGAGDPQPKNLTDPALQARLTDGEIFWKLSTGRRIGGHEYMPAFGGKVPSDEKRWAIVHFVRSLSAAGR